VVTIALDQIPSYLANWIANELQKDTNQKKEMKKL